MRKTIYVVATLLIVMILSTGCTNAKIVDFYKWRALADTEQLTPIDQADFTSPELSIRIAKAEGKYIIALTILDPNILVFYGDGDINSIISSPTEKPIFNEVSAENLLQYKVLIYKQKGFIYSKPFKAYSFVEISNIEEYSSIEQARDNLQ